MEDGEGMNRRSRTGQMSMIVGTLGIHCTVFPVLCLFENSHHEKFFKIHVWGTSLPKWSEGKTIMQIGFAQLNKIKM